MCSVVASSNLEMSLRLLVEMEELGFSPKMEIAQNLIILAAELGYPRLAIDLTYNFEASSVRKLDGKVWESCLAASAESYYKDGVVSMWPKVVQEYKMTLDEGLCLNALHTAGRHGLPDLAMEIFRTIKSIGIPLREHHFAPILEAAARTGRVKDAFSVLSLMRANHIVPESATAHPIFQALQESPASVDAAWDVLEELHKDNETIDILAINVIIQASISHGDLQRAIGIYQSISRFGLKPNVDTFNALLSGCIAARNRELGDRLLTDMREGGVVPDAPTYERLVVLCLTAPTYEDAFFYLEEMKAADHFPPYSVYEAIIRRCISEGDSRYQLALQELEEFGYQVAPRLQELIDSHAQSHSGERESTFDEVAARRRP
ncbi:hypothetical protein EWM64_g1829 [Hericium alpestre]|uniref:Pentatricopeptide repeat-containing protein-mitochondrial domain-containing protein n=1 Tax=Hericium alpestre TaxID=135208 RepID=A0A4Z0A793_9AGAM|nr:hypothetical protein EWM64_g1829 [Hericium alpestre]